jgi:hypothetical protein
MIDVQATWRQTVKPSRTIARPQASRSTRTQVQPLGPLQCGTAGQVGAAASSNAQRCTWLVLNRYRNFWRTTSVNSRCMDALSRSHLVVPYRVFICTPRHAASAPETGGAPSNRNVDP